MCKQRSSQNNIQRYVETKLLQKYDRGVSVEDAETRGSGLMSVLISGIYPAQFVYLVFGGSVNVHWGSVKTP